MINVSIQKPDLQRLTPKIAVIGVGGAGGNAVKNMKDGGQEGCDFIIANTDWQALQSSSVDNKIQLGANITGGLGAGSKPEVGCAAAEESLDEVMQYMEGANMVFVTAGMGGGTGTGAAPVIAKACRERGILTVGVVTKPFHFEGAHRMKLAEAGLQEMQKYVDTLIVIPNQNLFRIANEKTTFADAFHLADGVLRSGVQGVTDLMVRPGLVNLDFADIRTAMMEMGKAMMGTGEASGEKRAIEAAESAINNPLLDDVSMKGARGVIINVTGGNDMTLFEADEACNRIRDEVDPDANIIFGATFDDTMDGKMRVSIVATGIDKVAGTGALPHSGGLSAPLGGANSAAASTSGYTGGYTGGGSSIAAPSTPSTLGVPSGGGSGFKRTHNVATTASAPGTASFAATKQPAPVPTITAPASSMNSPAPRAYIPPAAPTPMHVQSQAQSIGKNAAQTVNLVEQELDMFDQGEFAQQSAYGNDSAQLPQNTSLRGAVYNNAFIPPKPIVPEAQDDVSGTQAQGFHTGQTAQQGPQSYVPYPSTGGLKLNPPKLPTPDQSPKKQQSLLERLTETVQQKLENMRDDNASSQKSRVAPAPSSVPADAAQQSLNIDAPAGAPTQKSDLDIPAFLRRQAN